jgi:lipopolysaccharide/colanic/teichoic acid biosynthesis glycosyltransferase
MIKRGFDVVFSIVVISLTSPVFLLSWLALVITTKSNGFFFQNRVGQFSNLFVIYKLRTIHPKTGEISTVAAFIRKNKLDELPQFFNVLKGDMSIVGPRPDIEGYYDKLEGEYRKILELKPGITSEASIKYYNEDEVLKRQNNPILYNDTVIFPDKVSMNLDYYYKQCFMLDLKIILKTITK